MKSWTDRICTQKIEVETSWDKISAMGGTHASELTVLAFWPSDHCCRQS